MTQTVVPPPPPPAIAEGDFLQLERVSKRYWTLPALDQVSFGIRRGEIFGYIGPNGAGKTTTIKILVGLIRDFDGTVVVGGHASPVSPEQMSWRLGYLPQKASFQEWRTVDQALRTFGRLSGLSSPELAVRIPEVLQRLGIADARYRRIVQLSGGTVQKVGMAQAILHRPPLLILDEPMAGLDPESRYEFKAIFKALRREGTTIFFSSHILGDVQDIADRVGILSRGHVLYVGSLEALRESMAIPGQIEILLAHDSGRPLPDSASGLLAGIEPTGPGRQIARLRPGVEIDDAIPALFDGFRAAGCRLRGIRPLVPDLDELYLRFVGEVRG